MNSYGIDAQYNYALTGLFKAVLLLAAKEYSDEQHSNYADDIEHNEELVYKHAKAFVEAKERMDNYDATRTS